MRKVSVDAEETRRTAPIIGASRAEQLTDLINAVDVELTLEEMTDLESAYQPHPVVGFE